MSTQEKPSHIDPAANESELVIAMRREADAEARASLMEEHTGSDGTTPAGRVQAIMEEHAAAIRQARVLQQAQDLGAAIRVLVHGHDLSAILAALSTELVRLGQDTVGFEAVLNNVIEARLGLVRRAHEVAEAQAKRAAELAALDASIKARAADAEEEEEVRHD